MLIEKMLTQTLIFSIIIISGSLITVAVDCYLGVPKQPMRIDVVHKTTHMLYGMAIAYGWLFWLYR